MIVVADASVLVGQLLRRRGRELLTHPNLRVVIAEDQWDEAEHELSRRLEILAVKGILTSAQRDVLQRSVRRLDVGQPTTFLPLPGPRAVGTEVP